MDKLLAEAGMAAGDIHGDEKVEPPHTAVARAIASSGTDTGLAIEAAASKKGLRFVKLARERYHRVCLKSELPTPPVQALLKELQGG